MKLVGSLTSPYVRKVRVVLAEKRIGYNFDVDIPWNVGSHVPDYNPLGKVPVLIMDDGAALFDYLLNFQNQSDLPYVAWLTNRSQIR